MIGYNEKELEHQAELYNQVIVDAADMLNFMRAVRLHNADGKRWTGFPRADELQRYCTECQQTAPCQTIRLAYPEGDPRA